jgi:hypothetical protein
MRVCKNVSDHSLCLEFISLSTLAGLVDENGKTLPTAPGQYTPNSRVESFARDNYKAAQVSPFHAAHTRRRLMYSKLRMQRKMLSSLKWTKLLQEKQLWVEK